MEGVSFCFGAGVEEKGGIEGVDEVHGNADEVCSVCRLAKVQDGEGANLKPWRVASPKQETTLNLDSGGTGNFRNLKLRKGWSRGTVATPKAWSKNGFQPQPDSNIPTPQTKGQNPKTKKGTGVIKSGFAPSKRSEERPFLILNLTPTGLKGNG